MTTTTTTTTTTNQLKYKDFVKVNGEVGYAIKKDDGTFGFWDGRNSYYKDSLETIKTFEIPTNEEKTEMLKDIFTWGKVTEVHVVNNYEYLIFETRDINGNARFRPYLNFKSISRVYSSFDRAMLGVFEEKYQGPNSQAAHHSSLIFQMDK